MILAPTEAQRQALAHLSQQPSSYARDLRLGQVYEQALADALTARGLPAYRPHQVFIPASSLQMDRQDGKCRIIYDHFLGTYRSMWADPSLLRPYQRDVMVKVSKVRRLSLEVKALTPSAFQAPLVHFGRVEKWDLKLFPVTAIVLINQQSLEAYTIPSAPEEWHRIRPIHGNGHDYAVPRASLTPLEAWIDLTASGCHWT
jgi:hypothetical protein